MAPQDIQAFLKQYFDVLQNQDLALFDRIFHPDCMLYSQQDGITTRRSFSEYRLMVAGRQSPQAAGHPRAEQVVMVDRLSDTMALAKVRLRLFDNIMVDYLNLMKVEGEWRIFAKLFYREGKAA
ncbi:nuclear transport factor 2 family protein [Chromobacterium phragmitis]|uniref:Nuclear transport factor 2 family protein n=1 Tax=Chromobacterium phragmitis TaxID=2202141 RepID=A0ABV0IPC1_9NEIS